jgi:ABC-type multidrug transport system fused ATPase/permease subunit
MNNYYSSGLMEMDATIKEEEEKNISVKAEPSDDAGPSAGSTPPAEIMDAFGTAEDEVKTEDENHLQNLLSEKSPEILEEGVQLGLKFLDDVKALLDIAVPFNNTQATHWLEAIRALQSLSKPSRTVVGVVGNTGAGKSSVINALLDEERWV